MAALTPPGTPQAELKGNGPKTIEKIEAAGVTSIERLADMTPEQLMEIPGIGEKMVEKIMLAVAAHFQSVEGQQAAPAEGEALAEPAASEEAATESAAGPAEGPEAEPAVSEARSEEEKQPAEPVDQAGAESGSGNDSEQGEKQE
jgi:N utilization substance protein A